MPSFMRSYPDAPLIEVQRPQARMDVRDVGQCETVGRQEHVEERSPRVLEARPRALPVEALRPNHLGRLAPVRAIEHGGLIERADDRARFPLLAQTLAAGLGEPLPQGRRGAAFPEREAL